MFDRIKRIIEADTSDLIELMRKADGDPETFWIGADLTGVDLRGQDLRSINLSKTQTRKAVVDRRTKFRATNIYSDRYKLGEIIVPEKSSDGGPLSSQIAPHLPFLRRYVRAVSGSQRDGDAYVSRMLEAMIAEPRILPIELGPKIALYRLFTSLQSELHLDAREDERPLGSIMPLRSNLRSPVPMSRQALLLIAVEGFAASEAAFILGVSSDELSELVDEASADIGRQISAEVIIIEDEPLIAMDIEQMVESLGHQVIGIAQTHEEAMSLFEKKRPGIILADVQLARGSSGVDAVKEILARSNINIPIIFITAFPERLSNNERIEDAFVVTKPFNPDMVKALISQALFFEEERRRES